MKKSLITSWSMKRESLELHSLYSATILFIFAHKNIAFVHCFEQIREPSENTNLTNYQLKPKGGRRRWGHHKEEWEDTEDHDLSLNVFGKSNFPAESRGDETWPR